MKKIEYSFKKLEFKNYFMRRKNLMNLISVEKLIGEIS